jgi:NADH pyrophosphatase NudC (nudix superfamily)
MERERYNGRPIRKARITVMRMRLSFHGSSEEKSAAVQYRFCPFCGKEMIQANQQTNSPDSMQSNEPISLPNIQSGAIRQYPQPPAVMTT